ncbi:superoxide dismutase, Fe-Mn family [Dyadobacter koreensis]|jgi:superoxide dismutase, Fe-Mn family|uniref:Superoxide dismutase n=1 Tax=Dyadobacter koreensis TaxID=408657 RepID=A0A1H7A6F7_9BACT|nr:superoxide dismutase [Dyadobacter koreensis]SEJ61008.1 superoxide dismutase, Fe-Mn family [Dyadobacter koreensis]
MAFTLDPLPYANNALEPHFDALTMEIHHDRHHQAYVTNLNAAVAGTELEGKTIEEIIKNISKAPAPVRNNGGGHWNHTFFWKSLSANGGGEPVGELGKAITAKFGSFSAFKDEFKKASIGRFGSGWAWLIVKDGGEIAITSSPNQDNPLMDIAETKGTPVIGLDVWEHAYYLKYQNKRPDYIDAYWNVVDWKAADALYVAAK